MTQQNIIELVQIDFPSINGTHIRILANQAMVEFSDETRMLRKTSTFTVDGVAIRFALPSDALYIDELYEDSTGTRIHHGGSRFFHRAKDGEVLWWIENDNIVVGYHNVSSGTFVPTANGTVYELRYRHTPTLLTSLNLTTELDFPSQYHDAIEARIKEKLHVGNLDSRRYWHAIWRDKVRKGQRYANKQRDDGSFTLTIGDLDD